MKGFAQIQPDPVLAFSVLSIGPFNSGPALILTLIGTMCVISIVALRGVWNWKWRVADGEQVLTELYQSLLAAGAVISFCVALILQDSVFYMFGTPFIIVSGSLLIIAGFYLHHLGERQPKSNQIMAAVGVLTILVGIFITTGVSLLTDHEGVIEDTIIFSIFTLIGGVIACLSIFGLVYFVGAESYLDLGSDSTNEYSGRVGAIVLTVLLILISLLLSLYEVIIGVMVLLIAVMLVVTRGIISMASEETPE